MHAAASLSARRSAGFVPSFRCFLFAAALWLVATAAWCATSLTLTAPAPGATLTATMVTLRATASEFTPYRVTFYEGNPQDAASSRYLGASFRNADGSYSLDRDFGGNGDYTVFAEVDDGTYLVRSPAVTFTIDNRTGTSTLTITAPAEGAVLTERTVTFNAMAANFAPNTVTYYFTAPDGTIDRYACGATRQPDGTYPRAYTFSADGAYGLLVEAEDGFGTVRSAPVHFSVDTHFGIASLTVAPTPFVGCGTAVGTITLTRTAPNDVTFSITSSHPAAAVPRDVTVPLGHSSATFAIEITPVRAETQVSITATGVAMNKAATLVLKPPVRYAYRVDDPGTLGGTTAFAFGINASGQMTGYSTTATGHSHAFRTSSAMSMTDLDPNGTNSCGYAINAAGQVAGFAVSGTQLVAFRTDVAGAISTLPSPGLLEAYANAINSAGDVVGFGITPAGDTRAFRAGADGAVTDLGLFPNGTYAYASAINDAGRIVGFGDLNSTTDRGFRTSTAGEPLADMGALGTGLSSYIYAQNALNDGTGEAYIADDSFTHLLLVDAAGTPHDLGGLPDLHVQGLSINREGDIVGRAYTVDTQGRIVADHAFRYTTAQGMVDLNTLIDPRLGWSLLSAEGINDPGQIAGWGTHNGQVRAFRLTPTVLPLRYGDADNDGDVDMQDAGALLRASAGLAPVAALIQSDVAPSPACAASGFGDGAITVADAVRVVRYVKGLEPVWP